MWGQVWEKIFSLEKLKILIKHVDNIYGIERKSKYVISHITLFSISYSYIYIWMFNSQPPPSFICLTNVKCFLSNKNVSGKVGGWIC